MNLLSPDWDILLAQCLLGIVLLASFAFTVYALVLACRNRKLSTGQKVTWVVVILWLNLPGALLYLILNKAKGPDSR